MKTKMELANYHSMTRGGWERGRLAEGDTRYIKAYISSHLWQCVNTDPYKESPDVFTHFSENRQKGSAEVLKFARRAFLYSLGR